MSYYRVLLALAVLAVLASRAFGDPRLTEHTLLHDGHRRAYLVYTPKDADRFDGKRPLVLVLHGGGGTHTGMPRLTKHRFHKLADRDGFFVVYPNAISKSWDFGEGLVSEQRKTRVDDESFFRRLLERLQREYPIDPAQIFATGISRGGQASYFLACRFPGVFRAIAPVTMPLPAFLLDDCQEGPPVGVAVFNGTADPLVPYDGGQIKLFGRKRGRLLSTDETMALWRRRNGCQDEVETLLLPDRDRGNTTVERFDWRRCTGAPVRLYRIKDGGHTWPSGGQYLPRALVGKVTGDIDGATEIWDFFSTFGNSEDGDEPQVELSGFRGNGGRVAWSPDGEFVVFDRRPADGGYDLYLTEDFETERCLTCNQPDLPDQKRNYGQPAVHPNGRYIVFQAEKQKHGFVVPIATNPGAGVFNDIWLYDLETDRAKAIWEVPNDKRHGILHPHFSKDGSRLSWSEMYEGAEFKHPGKGAGVWTLKVADFTTAGLRNVQKLQPGEDVIYENHGFSHDGEWLYFSSNMKRSEPVNESTNIYRIHLDTGKLERLTEEGYNEHAHISPDGKYIVWMSSVGNGETYDYYRVGTDYWLMNIDGTGKRRLTHLNDPDHTHFRGRYAVVADFAFDPASSQEHGYRLFAYLHELVTKNFLSRPTNKKARGEYNFFVSFAVDSESDNGSPKPNGPSSPEPTEAAVAEIPLERIALERITADGGRLDWSPDGKTIAFDRKGDDGLFDIWEMRADGSGEPHCLTCNAGDSGLPVGRQIGQPAYHPSGQWLAMQVEREGHHKDSEHAHPGAGVFHDLWVLHRPSDRAYRLTAVSDGRWGRPKGGSLHPVFSHDGKRLLWSEMERGFPGLFGDWRMTLATFDVSKLPPKLRDYRYLEPGQGGHWFETHGFGPDDQWIYFAGNLMGTSVLHSDIARLDLATGEFERLTHSAGPRADEPGGYDEHAQFTPRFDAFSYLSSEAGRGQEELWLASPDGSTRRQVTYFNMEGTADYELVGGQWSMPSDNAWNPHPPPGKEQLLLYLQVDFKPFRNASSRNEIFLIEFERHTP